MTPTTHVLLSGALTFGVPLVLAVGQLIALRRRPGDGWKRDPRIPPPPPPKPLPDCLIPRLPLLGLRRPPETRPDFNPVRVLEDA